MKNKKILILGGNGYIAKTIYQNFANMDESIRVELSKDRINDQKDAFNLIKKSDPDLVINCIGKTGGGTIDACANDPWGTFFGNAIVPRYIAQASRDLRVKMLHFGTGGIYDGDNFGAGFKEEDSPNFFGNVYIRSKIAAEEFLRDFPEVLQLRINMPINSLPDSRNLVTKVLRYARSGGPILDAPNSITYIPDMISTAISLIDLEASGIYNVTNSGKITLPEILSKYEAISGNKLNYKLFKPSSFEGMTKEKRSNCFLSLDKINSLGIDMRPISEAVEEGLVLYVNHEEKNEGFKGECVK